MSFTNRSAAVTAGFAATALVDPTGIAAFSTVTMALVTSVAGACKLTKKGIDYARELSERKESNLSLEEIEQLRSDTRDAIWKLSAASVGTSASITMSLVFPWALVGLALNAPVFYKEGKKLEKLAAKAGGHRALFSAMSKADVAAQVALGGTCKVVLLVVFLGNDFDLLAEGISRMIHDDPSCVKAIEAPQGSPLTEHTKQAIDMHNGWIHDGPLEIPANMADFLPEQAKDIMGAENTPIYHDGTPLGTIAVIGLAAAVPELVGQQVVENPAQKGANKKKSQN